MTTKKAETTEATEESPYAKDADEVAGGKPVGPEHDGSFHAPDFYDPKTGERIPTDWDSEAQKNDPGIGAPPTDGSSGGEGGEVTPAKTTPTTKDG